MELPEVHDAVTELTQNKLFKSWKDSHPQCILSHLFSPLDAQYRAKSFWEIAFYDPKKEKIVVFTPNQEGEITLQKEDDIFKRESDVVEELDLKSVALSFEKARAIFADKVKELFPKMQVGDGFIVLQTVMGKTLWNFTFITKTLQFINIKINAASGEIDSHQAVELMQKN